jgi:CheY-like chemotaxis protein
VGANKLLVVEDDPGQLETRRLLLERFGYEVIEASNTDEALAAFREHSPPCVLMDLRLPRAEDGRRLIRGIHKADKGARIIVLSGYPQDLEKAPEFGLVTHLLCKPVRTQTLLAILKRP